LILSPFDFCPPPGLAPKDYVKQRLGPVFHHPFKLLQDILKHMILYMLYNCE
jgi:hypothetical protein